MSDRFHYHNTVLKYFVSVLARTIAWVKAIAPLSLGRGSEHIYQYVRDTDESAVHYSEFGICPKRFV